MIKIDINIKLAFSEINKFAFYGFKTGNRVHLYLDLKRNICTVKGEE